MSKSGKILSSSSEEFENHISETFRSMALSLTSVSNLLKQGQHVAAYEKVNSLRDSAMYYMKACKDRQENQNND